MSSLTLEPLLSPAVWLALAACGAALLTWYGLGRPGRVSRRRWAAVLALSAVSLAAVLVVLLNPTWVEAVRPDGGKPTLTILVDATGSMATADGSDGRTRFRAAADVARSVADGLADRYDVRVKTFADAVGPADFDAAPAGRDTDLAAAVRAGVEADRPGGQAVVLLSDGIHTAGGTVRVLDACRTAKAMACPVYTRTFGGDAQVKDLAVELRAPQEVGFVNQKLSVPVLVRNRGYDRTPATVVLSADGRDVDRRTVPLTAAGTSEVRFEVARPTPGLYGYTVRVEPAADEVNRANNASLLVVRVVDRPVKVLVLEGKPYWDGKFLARTLAADPSVELHTVVRLGDNRLIRRTLTRPAAEGQDAWAVLPDAAAVFKAGGGLKDYQVVVLGRDADVYLTDGVLSSLQEWVSRDGGCLVCYRGSPTSQTNARLGKLLPVRWTPTPEARFQLKLTDRGRDLRLFPPLADATADPLAQLPELATAAHAEPPKPLAVVLATAGPRDGKGDPEPVLCYQPYGSGRAVVIEGAGMWRWAFLPPHQQALDDVYRSVWSGLVRWLVSTAELLPGQTLAVRAEKVRFQPGESAGVSVFVRDGGPAGGVPALELRTDAGAAVRTVAAVPVGDDPNTYRVAFGPLPEGRYEVRTAGGGDASPKTAFEVRDPSTEKLDLKARPDLMARIADESGGASLDGKPLSDLPDAIRQHWQQARPPQVRRVPAWDRAWVLVGVIAVWAAAWVLRRSAGLV